jgi:ribosomal protein S18 acetylase RimI-like enzyme
MECRIATQDDFAQLAELRWESRAEEGHEEPAVSREAFLQVCQAFFERCLKSGILTQWVALDGSEIVACLSVIKVPLVPRPCKLHDWFGYICDNYTRPAHRNCGIGSELLARAKKRAEIEDLELLIVWPSDRAVTFYERAGFRSDNSIMELVLREYYSPDWTARRKR